MKGWTVVRFSDQQVEEDTEAVARAIAVTIGIDYSFQRRDHSGSGKQSVRAKKPKAK